MSPREVVPGEQRVPDKPEVHRPRWHSRPAPGSRLLARAVQIAGAMGMLGGLIALLATPLLAAKALGAADRALDGVISQAQAGAEILFLASDSLGGAAGGLRQSASVVSGVEVSLRDSAPILEGTANLLEDQAPATIIETRNAIMGAQAGATAIDSFLRAISVVLPFSGLDYSAEDSLAEGLAQTADSLAPLPADFASLGGQIREFSEDLNLMDEELTSLREDMGDLADSLTDAATSLRRQAAYFDDLSQGLEASRPAILRSIGLLAWVWGIVALWLLISQYGLYALGGALLQASEASPEEQSDIGMEGP
jgi:hypothetical protein